MRLYSPRPQVSQIEEEAMSELKHCDRCQQNYEVIDSYIDIKTVATPKAVRYKVCLGCVMELTKSLVEHRPPSPKEAETGVCYACRTGHDIDRAQNGLPEHTCQGTGKAKPFDVAKAFDQAVMQELLEAPEAKPQQTGRPKRPMFNPKEKDLIKVIERLADHIDKQESYADTKEAEILEAKNDLETLRQNRDEWKQQYKTYRLNTESRLKSVPKDEAAEGDDEIIESAHFEARMRTQAVWAEGKCHYMKIKPEEVLQLCNLALTTLHKHRGEWV